jgi:hypothetical protein
MSLLQNSNAISAGGYDINNSLRFRQSASARLSRTPGSAGNRKTWTWSAWVKISTLTSAGAQQGLFSARSTSTDQLTIFYQNEQIHFGSGGSKGAINTNAVLRDVSAWYHIVVVLDATNATTADRAIIYLNGTRQSVTTTTSFTNADHGINATIAHSIGAEAGTNTLFFDGYMAEINFIDGQALTPSSFGETDTTTGSWKPKAYTSTYGTNGFYLKFSDIATTSGSNAGLGKDFSGNTNYWTTNNISVTAGTTYDAMIDSPTLTSATVANYCVLNPLFVGGGVTISNGNLREVQGATYRTSSGTIYVSSGKWYFEMVGAGEIGVVRQGAFDKDTRFGYGANQSGGYAYNNYDGEKANNGSGSAYGAAYSGSDTVACALDLDNGTITFYKNNVSQGTAFSSLPAGLYTFACGHSSATVDVNFGQRPFTYTPPTGFVRLNTYNLPDSTIKKGNTVMDALLWTGNEATPRAITGSQFAPDFVWLKARSFASQNHHFVDSVRGFGTNTMRTLYSLATVAEDSDKTNLSTAVSYGNVLSLDSNGFTVQDGSNGNDQTNNNTITYVSWLWNAGGSTVTNTSGTISSQVRANPTAGFSIVTYTGTGANATVGHGLGVAPRMVIVKARSAVNDWPVYHIGQNATPQNGLVYLNGTNAYAAASTIWNNTAPTSTTFAVGTSGATNASSVTFVAYCWAAISGYSAFGSYTGNGSADGVFVYTGFVPKFVLIKKTSGADNWLLYDTARDTYNVAGKYLSPNLSAAEGTDPALDMLSNGFKIRQTGGGINGSGATYIYAAFASNPFKNSNAF